MAGVDNFKKFGVDYTIKWDDDLDLVLEYFYFKAFETDSNLTNQLQERGYI